MNTETTCPQERVNSKQQSVAISRLHVPSVDEIKACFGHYDRAGSNFVYSGPPIRGPQPHVRTGRPAWGGSGPWRAASWYDVVILHR